MVVVCGLSCSVACRIFQGQGLSLCLLHWQVDSLPLSIDPIDPNEVKNCYQNWETGKASNLQLIFYRGKKASDDILVKALLNGIEATLPLPSQLAPYYKWSDFRKFYLDRCDSIKDEP